MKDTKVEPVVESPAANIASTASTIAQETTKPEPTPSPQLANVEVKPTTDSPKTSAQETKPEEDDGHLSDEELKRIADALKTISSDSALTDVKETFNELKQNRKSFIQVYFLIGCGRIQTAHPKRTSNNV